MRLSRRGTVAFALAAVVVSAGFGGAGVGSAAAAAPSSRAVATSPAPGDGFASSQTSISFRGISPAALGSVRVTGSRSGVHAGTLVSDPAGATIWKPQAAFVAGERVSVDTAVLIAGANGNDFSFTVARVDPDAPEVLSPAGGTGPEGAVDASASTTAPQVAATCTPPVPSYHSEPSLTPAGACVNQSAGGTAPGYLFVAPRDSRGSTAAIYDDAGELIWDDPVNAAQTHDLKTVSYAGKPMLAFFQSSAPGFGFGRGEYVLMDEHYQVVSYIRAGDGYQADLHELTMTPQDTALVGCYVPVRMDLTGSGGTANQVVYDYVVQEIDVATGNVLFSWHSLDHVPVADSDIPVPADGSAFDYFHGNSIALSSGGNLLISGRNTSAVYLVNRSTGAIIWRLGGKHTNFTLPTGQQWFCYQHDARQPAANVVTVFDDGGSGPAICANHPSRALTLTVNTSNHTATTTRDLHHDPDLSAAFLGSNQTLPNGDALASWGQLEEITEFNAANQSIFDMSLSGATYRATRAPWTGTPNYPPAIASSKGSGTAVTVYASWNGATEVASWQVLAGSTPTSMSPVGVPAPKSGFETALTVDTTEPLVAVQALDASNTVLATSPTVPTDYTPPAGGYYVGTTAGNVYNYGAPFLGSLAASGKKPAAPLVGTVAAPTRSGYYLPSSAGNVYNFGAAFYGSLAGKTLPAPVVGLAASGGTGYYLATSKGNVYNFHVPWYGSMAGKAMPGPVIGIAVDQNTGGYWLLTSKGNVYNFHAPWYGSMAGKTSGFVGIAAEPDGAGYLLVTSRGNVYNFGRAPWYGSPAASVVHLASPVVGVGTQQPTGAQPQPTGYYVVCANGDVYNYGIPLPGSPSIPPPAPIDGISAR
jgi:hypothetical protein